MRPLRLMGSCYSITAPLPSSATTGSLPTLAASRLSSRIPRLLSHLFKSAAKQSPLPSAATEPGWYLTSGTVSSPTKFWQSFSAFGSKHTAYTLEDCMLHIQQYLHTDRDWLEGVELYYGSRRVDYQEAEAYYLHLQHGRQQLMVETLSNSSCNSTDTSVPTAILPTTVTDLIASYTDETADYKHVLITYDAWQHKSSAGSGIAVSTN